MFIEIRYVSTLLEHCYISKNFLNKPVRGISGFWADLTNAAKLSRAIMIAIARCDAYEMNTWEGRRFKVATFYYTNKILSMTTQICDYFAKFVYIRLPENLATDERR
jgi:hypothetical protein